MGTWLPANAAAAAPAQPGDSSHAKAADPSTVPPDQRDNVLPGGWRTSRDLMWTTDGDATGFHLLVADSATGYGWRTAATLAEPWIETDRWIGNACLTGSGGGPSSCTRRGTSPTGRTCSTGARSPPWSTWPRPRSPSWR